MGSPLFNMLADLAANQGKIEEFNTNPDGLMAKYGLDEEQKKLLKEGGEYNYIKALMEESKQTFTSETKLCL